LKCNLATVVLEKIAAGDEERMVKEMIQRHQAFTGSEPAMRALSDWSSFLKKCVKVMPIDYKAVLEEAKRNQAKPVPATV